MDELKPACCLECHFAWEETVLFPQLPKSAARSLWNEHEGLRKPGTTPEMIEAHARREMVFFRVYCTEVQVAQCELDHAHLAGKVH